MNAILTALAQRPPDDLVIEGQPGNYSAGELLSAVENLRAVLVAKGIDRLGLLAENGAPWIIVDLACQLAGTCLLPLPVFFSDTQLRNSLESAGVATVLTDDPARIAGLFADAAATVVADAGTELAMVQLATATQPPLPAGTRKITFTSGTTGSPRGVCLGVDQQMRVAQALNTVVTAAAPRHLCLLPLSTLLENIAGIYCPMLAGGTVIVPPEADTGFSGSTGLNLQKMLQAIARHQPTSIILLPQMLVGLVAALDAGWQPPAALEFVAVGGGKVGASLVKQARSDGLPVYEGYGLSETASVACLNVPGSDLPGSVGRPLDHVQLTVEAGEIIVHGNCFLGYVNDPASWNPSRVATGDLGHVDDDGFVHITGRKKHVLISSFGRNISPEWIETELLRHPEIAQCVVLGDDRPYCAALLAATDSRIGNDQLQQLIDEANRDLPDYAQIKTWYRLPRILTPADGLITDNGRPRRAMIENCFESAIESLYPESKRAAAS